MTTTDEFGWIRQKHVMMSDKFVMTSKTLHGVKVRHAIKNTWKVRHVKNMSWRQEVCRDVKGMLWRQKWFLLAFVMTLKQFVKTPKKFVITSKIRHDIMKFVMMSKTFHVINKRPPGLIAPPFTIDFLTTDNLPKVKLGQVEVGSNITQNHSSRL